MRTTFVGVDVGLDGAIAALIPGAPVPAFFDMPVDTLITGTKTKPTKRRVVNGTRLRHIFHELKQQSAKIFVLVETPQMRSPIRPALPLIGRRPHRCSVCHQEHFIVNQGLSTQANFVGSGKLIDGILLGLQIPFDGIHPSVWMADVFHGRSEKLGHRQLASQLYPAAASSLELVKHDGRAEALLLADYAQRHHEAPF